jgi:hypothetical protein
MVYLSKHDLISLVMIIELRKDSHLELNNNHAYTS